MEKVPAYKNAAGKSDTIDWDMSVSIAEVVKEYTYRGKTITVIEVSGHTAEIEGQLAKRPPGMASEYHFVGPTEILSANYTGPAHMKLVVIPDSLMADIRQRALPQVVALPEKRKKRART